MCVRRQYNNGIDCAGRMTPSVSIPGSNVRAARVRSFYEVNFLCHSADEEGAGINLFPTEPGGVSYLVICDEYCLPAEMKILHDVHSGAKMCEGEAR